MTAEERIKAVSDFGFTERQARFMVTVMLNGGVCVPRQYARSVGTAYGQNVNVFFDKLVKKGFAGRCSCVHNRAAVYQLGFQPLYRAIGEPESPNRKPIAAARVVERLMLLDAVISQPDLVWLSTASDKVAFFTVATPSCPPERLPHATIGTGEKRRVRQFPDALPIGVERTGRPVFLFVVNTWDANDLRAFLQRHAELPQRLPGWTVRLALPPDFAAVKTRFEGVAGHELARSLSPGSLAELRWYFEQRQRQAPREKAEADRFRRAERAFAGVRWRLLYRRWLTAGDSALDVATSPAIREALARGGGVIESEVLPHSYRHLSPLASLVRARVKGLRRGNAPWETLNPSGSKGGVFCRPLVEDGSCDHEEPWRERPHPGAGEGVPRRIRGRSRHGS